MPVNPKKPAVSASYVKVILDALNMRGIDTENLKRVANIGETVTSSGEEFITVEQYQNLIIAAKNAAQDPALGIYVGRFFEVGTHGILSYAALGMPTVWECLKLGEKFARIRSPILEVRLDYQDDEAVISFDTSAFKGEVYQFVMEGVICSYYAILNLIFEDNIPPAQINVRYPAPTDTDAYQQLLGEKVKFSSSKNEMCFPRQMMEKPLTTANSVIASELDQRINELLLAVEENSLVEQVKQLLMNTIGIIPSQDSIAEHLNMSTRTLRRQLKNKDTSYQALLNEVRRDLAISHLENTSWGIEEIAYLLGFSSAAHFSYAFKKWTDLAPKHYRDAL